MVVWWWCGGGGVVWRCGSGMVVLWWCGGGDDGGVVWCGGGGGGGLVDLFVGFAAGYNKAACFCFNIAFFFFFFCNKSTSVSLLPRVNKITQEVRQDVEIFIIIYTHLSLLPPPPVLHSSIHDSIQILKIDKFRRHIAFT